MPRLRNLMGTISLILMVCQPTLAMNAKEPIRAVVLCDQLLSPRALALAMTCPLANCSKVYELFDRGLDDDEDILAFTGISYHEMGELLKQGRVLPEFKSFDVSVTADNSAGKDLLRGDLNKEQYSALSKFGTHKRKVSFAQAASHATVRSSLDKIFERLLEITDKTPSPNREMMAALELIINAAPESKNISFADIFRVMEKVDFFKEQDLAAVDEELSEEVSQIRNLSADANDIATYRKIKLLMHWMNLPSHGIVKSSSAVKTQLVQLFGKLPRPHAGKRDQEGFVIALRKDVAAKLQRQKPFKGIYLKNELSLDDIAGIEPLTTAGFQFLRSLKDE